MNNLLKFKTPIKGLIFSLFWLLVSTVSAQETTARQNSSFNADWQFKKMDGKDDWQKITLPHTWNAVDMQLGKDFYEGEGQYQKKVFFGEEYKNKRLFLRFEGVGQVAEVLVNGKSVGKHKGSYSAFCVELTYDVNLGKENTILVKANNTARKDVIPVNHFLFGIYGGIYRPVSLIVTNKVNITTTDYASPGIYITQKNVSKESASIAFEVKVENKEITTQALEIVSRIYNKEGKEVLSHATKELCSPQGRQSFRQEFVLKNPHLWQGLADPYLYKMKVSILRNHEVIDEVEQPLGIRKFEIIAGKEFLLNGKPYPMYGVCRHQDRWGYGNALTNEQHREDLEAMKEMGATTIRFAHYQQAEFMYSLCDTMGMVIWAEIPFVNAQTGEEAENAKQQMMELVKQNFNHPSIYTWGLHNEVYARNPADYVATVSRDLNDVAKTLDPDRYTVSVTGYGEMTRPANLTTDIQGMNRYWGTYDGKILDMESWASGLEKAYPNYKMMLTEYGADGNIFQQKEAALVSDTVGNYNGPYLPETFETKVHEQQWPIIAKHPYIIASYIWNMFDFAVPMWSRGGVPARNTKGLVTFDRKLKKDVFYWYKANWSKEPVLYLTERRVVDRKNAKTQIRLYSNVGKPDVFLNGKKITTTPVIDTTGFLYAYNVVLKKGKNIIKTSTIKDGKLLNDEMIWMFNGAVKK